jgi:hypothetical protein
MRIAVPVTDLLRRLSDHLNRVVARSGLFVLLRGGKRVAGLRSTARLGDLPGLMADLPPLGEDADTFAADLEAARAELDARGPDDWPEP